MSVDSNLRTLTLQNTAVVATIGQRYYVDHIPDGATYPCVRAQTVTEPFERTHGGSFGGRARVQLDVYDDDEINCNAAADALIGWLDNYKGGMGNYNVTIQLKNKQGGWEVESRLFRRMLEIEVLYFSFT